MKFFKYIVLIIVAVSLNSCAGGYSFTGASISSDVESFQVNFFQNNANLVEPGLDRDFTNSLIDLLLNQTNLDLVKSNGHLIYEGEITEYRISPTTATAEITAAQNRLTMTVNVRFFNMKNEEDNFEQRFSFFYDYPASAQLTGAVRVAAYEEIFERLTQDIFNASLAKW